MMCDPAADIGLADREAAEVGVDNVCTTWRMLGKDLETESVPEDTLNCTFGEVHFLCDLGVDGRALE
jgi:hypothetical protein